MPGSRLVVFSSVSHFQNDQITAHAGFVNEMRIWARIFEKVMIITILDSNKPTNDTIPYQVENIEFIWLDSQINTSGFSGKIRLINKYRQWINKSLSVLLPTDTVMARGPDSIGFIGFIVSQIKKLPHFAKYADQWQNFKGEPTGYRLQKIVYRSRFFGGPVQIYGKTNPKRPHLIPFFTSSITLADWCEAGEKIKHRDFSLPFRLLFVGRLVEAKGVDLIINATHLLVNKGSDVILDIVGDGPEKNHLIDLTNDLGLSDVISFSGELGWQELKEKYATNHCFIHASRKEGFGKVLIEAMTYGLPIIGTDVGVTRTLLNDPKYGRIVKANDPQAISEMINDVKNNYSYYKDMGDRARSFCKSLILENVETIYRDFAKNYLNMNL